MNIKLNDNERFLLRNIFEPEIVAVPPSDAHRNMCMMPDGEIRYYGHKEIQGKMQRIYISSRDAGLSWKTVAVLDDNENGTMVRSPWSGDFITILRTKNYNVLSLPAINNEPDGVYLIRSAAGPGSTEHKLTKISSSALLDIRQPIPMRNKKRWLCTAQKWHEGALCPVVLISDDDAVSWREITLETVAPHVATPPHKGNRWQQYSCEPTLIELNSGRLMMISRTSQDFHYIYYSEDSGETWTSPVAADSFHACTTMPTLLRLSDGRLLFFWCNTQPLPELDHSTQKELSPDEMAGVWEDVFTNRDACHAAISDDDGKTWKGFREINLNSVRNNADFRTITGPAHSDKSVHQFEALELPEKKVLLALGQAPSSRKLVIFDPEWLYEKSRKEDFNYGLVNLSTHVYVKSLSGGHRGHYAGHCAWNRTNGALLLSSPDGEHREVLCLGRIKDERLFSEVQGAVWNYPASRKGTLRIELRIEGAPLRISLTDRWFNPLDVSVADLTQLSLVITKENLPADKFWSELKIEWDLDLRKADIFINGKYFRSETIKADAPAGFSYLHLQNTAESEDTKGILIKSLNFSA